jgi:hypothetical protein
MSVGGVYHHDDIIHEIILEINYEIYTDLPGIELKNNHKALARPVS